MKQTRSSFPGFTLIETLIYSTLVSLAIGVIILSTLSLLESYNRDRERQAVVEAVSFLDHKLDWLFDGTAATSITLDPLTPSLLTSIRADGIQIRLEQLGDGILLTRDSNADGQITSDEQSELTSSHVSVANLNFVRTTPNGQPVLTVTATLTGEFSTRSFSKRIILQ